MYGCICTDVDEPGRSAIAPRRSRQRRPPPRPARQLAAALLTGSRASPPPIPAVWRVPSRWCWCGPGVRSERDQQPRRPQRLLRPLLAVHSRPAGDRTGHGRGPDRRGPGVDHRPRRQRRWSHSRPSCRGTGRWPPSPPDPLGERIERADRRHPASGSGRTRSRRTTQSGVRGRPGRAARRERDRRPGGGRSAKDLGLAEALAFPLIALLAFLIFRGSPPSCRWPSAPPACSLAFALLRAVNVALPLSVFALNLVIGLGLGLAVNYSLFLVHVSARSSEPVMTPPRPSPRR